MPRVHIHMHAHRHARVRAPIDTRAPIHIPAPLQTRARLQTHTAADTRAPVDIARPAHTHARSLDPDTWHTSTVEGACLQTRRRGGSARAIFVSGDSTCIFFALPWSCRFADFLFAEGQRSDICAQLAKNVSTGALRGPAVRRFSKQPQMRSKIGWRGPSEVSERVSDLTF